MSYGYLPFTRGGHPIHGQPARNLVLRSDIKSPLLPQLLPVLKLPHSNQQSNLEVQSSSPLKAKANQLRQASLIIDKMFSKNVLFGLLAASGTLLSAVTAAAIATPSPSPFPGPTDKTFSDGKNGTRLAAGGEIWLTPHDHYSSSVGVLGCKVDTNHFAYWPEAISCNDFCMEVSYEGRSALFMHLDNSAGAHDVSFENWNYLETGYPASEKTHIKPSGGFKATYKSVDPNRCRGLMKTGKLPLSAATSINFLANCVLNEPNSWVAQNYELWNIYDSQCNLGKNELCTPPDLKNGFNQATCAHQLGNQEKLEGQDVYNILYPSGDKEEIKGPGEP